MQPPTIVITARDHAQLQECVHEAAEKAPKLKGRRDLAAELSRATVVDAHEIPASVVTMHSTVRVRDLDNQETSTYTLVYPREADLDTGRISVLSPIGTAMLGYQVGDEIEWQVPAGVRRLAIDAVLYQPEAAGHFRS